MEKMALPTAAAGGRRSEFTQWKRCTHNNNLNIIIFYDVSRKQKVTLIESSFVREKRNCEFYCWNATKCSKNTDWIYIENAFVCIFSLFFVCLQIASTRIVSLVLAPLFRHVTVICNSRVINSIEKNDVCYCKGKPKISKQIETQRLFENLKTSQSKRRSRKNTTWLTSIIIQLFLFKFQNHSWELKHSDRNWIKCE